MYSALGEAGLAPPQAAGAPMLQVRAPDVGEASRGARRGGWALPAEGGGDDSDGAGGDGGGGGDGGEGDGDSLEEGPAAALELAPALPPTPAQVAPRMATLAGTPRAQWLALVALETVRSRGRPARPPAKPQAAPFLLPTVAGLSARPVFAVDAAVARPGRASRVRSVDAAADGGPPARSPLLRAVLRGAASSPPDFSEATSHLASCGPSALDAELRGVTLAAGDTLGSAEEEALAALLGFFEAALGHGTAFELLHAALAVLLRVHGDAIHSAPALQKRAAMLLDTVQGGWVRLDASFNEALSALDATYY